MNTHTDLWFLLETCDHKSALSKLDRMCAIRFLHCIVTSGSV